MSSVATATRDDFVWTEAERARVRNVGVTFAACGVAVLFAIVARVALGGDTKDDALLGTLAAGGLLLVLAGLGIAVPASQDYLIRAFRTVFHRKDEAATEPSETRDGAPEAEVPADFPGSEEEPVHVEERWPLLESAKRPFRAVLSPTYVLDRTYRFVEWNAAFDEIVAKPLGLQLGQHVFSFIEKLENSEAVIEHSRETFRPGRSPRVDVETLEFRSPRYGLVRFRKIAAQVGEDSNDDLAWCINLNIESAEEDELLWEDLKQRLSKVVNWTRYAISYDRLLLNFQPYKRLVADVVAKVGPARLCADLGAGTGNGTVELLRTLPGREVWAVEPNDAMLERLGQKLRALDAEQGTDFDHHVVKVKEDVARLSELESGQFDAAVLINVLYAVDDPQHCLDEIARILKPGGVLALSTSHRDTDVDALFARMRGELERKGRFRELERSYQDALEVHRKMDAAIHRDSKDDIRGYLEAAGFEIEGDLEPAYEGAVVVAKAIKRTI